MNEVSFGSRSGLSLVESPTERVTGKGMQFANGEDHKAQRKYLMPAFSPIHVKKLLPIFWQETTKMIHGIEDEIRKSDSQDHSVFVTDWSIRAALDIIGLAGMGYEFNSLGNPHGEHRHLTKAVKIIEARKEKLACEETDEAQGTVGKDIITVALRSGMFSSENLVHHVMTSLVVGHLSTAITFDWVCFELGQRPEMQARLRKEIRTQWPGGLEQADVSTIETLPYLNANLWGDDAHVFNPERWIGQGRAGSGGASSNFAMLTFSAGPKNCIGHFQEQFTLHRQQWRRYAGIISGAGFDIDGVRYETSANGNGGTSTFNGGEKGWGRRVMDIASHSSNSITFVVFDRGWNGFPGTPGACITHTVTPYKWDIAIGLTPVRDSSPVSVSQQVFWNLDGFAAETNYTVAHHKLQLPYSGFRFAMDEDNIPTGDMKSNAQGSTFDFWSGERRIKDGQKAKPAASGNASPTGIDETF
ncbi:unnamed protein product [Parascedosporium putredinis]|uniref:Cytochrome P450 n=1 Tax=Parascedosporium putredinis TaxID=1442378 RepID=A0A9P1H5Q6_9PEZI|nr:unnamed protein product [Parascedosporium putredinis]CAI7996671.1 unnamed protein product [Parascedosporium putredinis]